MTNEVLDRDASTTAGSEEDDVSSPLRVSTFSNDDGSGDDRGYRDGLPSLVDRSPKVVLTRTVRDP